jgi:hypothetical protein
MVRFLLFLGIFLILTARTSWPDRAAIEILLTSVVDRASETSTANAISPTTAPMRTEKADLFDVQWVLDRYSHTSQENRTRLLIAQYTGSGYSALFDITSPVNEAYAKLHGYDFLSLRGIVYGLPDTKEEPIIEARATYNKVAILQMALRMWKDQYDQLLILDADAIIVSFQNRDSITSLMPQDKMLVAHRVQRNDIAWTKDINIGVSLWNLKHDKTLWMANRWEEKILERIARKVRTSDQAPLQKILRNDMTEQERARILLAVSDEFGDKGRLVKHVMRPKNAQGIHSYNDTYLDQRASRLQEMANAVCERFAPACE